MKIIVVCGSIDRAESGDTIRKDAEPEVYNILLELGDKLWGDSE